MSPRTREILAIVAGIAIGAAASHYGGALGGKVAERLVVPIVQERIREPGVRLWKPGEKERLRHEIGPLRAALPGLAPRPAESPCAARDRLDAAYFRALSTSGVVPRITHEEP